ncbi:hypothetical protein, partial [Pseudomonas protegens]|uniref:hypothetical protein n=1 Tax=Pseudomonas protegens TaxID=380021 RepID=UPI001C833473
GAKALAGSRGVKWTPAKVACLQSEVLKLKRVFIQCRVFSDFLLQGLCQATSCGLFVIVCCWDF